MANKDRYSVKKAMQLAFLSLLAQKPLADITVTEIVKTAKVARVSFYRHFSSISNLMDTLVDQAAELFSSELIPPICSKDEEKWHAFLIFYFRQIAHNAEGFLRINSVFDDTLNARMTSKVGQVLEGQPDPTVWEMYSWFGKLGLLRSIAQIWVSSGMRETPEEMTEYVMSLIRNIDQAGGEGTAAFVKAAIDVYCT